MEDTDDAPLQFQREKLVHQRLKIMLFLCGSHQVHKDLSCCVSSPQEKMAQVSCMLHLFIVADAPLSEMLQHAHKNLIHIRMHQSAVRCCQDIISASFFMKAQGERPVLILIPKGELHLVPVSELFRACLYTLEDITSLHCLIHDPPNLPFLHLHLFFIGHGLIHTAAAGGKDAADGLSCLQRRLLQHLKEPSLCISTLEFIDEKTHFLSRHSVLHRDILVLLSKIHDPLIRKVHSLYSSFKNLSFLHLFLHVRFICFITAKQAGCSPSTTSCLYSVSSFFDTGSVRLLYLVILIEIVIEVIVKIIFEVFQIVRCEETVYRIRDRCDCCNCSDDRQHPDHCVFLFLCIISVQQLS